MDGYPGALESTIEQIAVEHFLKGCIDHRAASVAMNKNPTHIHKAVKYTKDAINNRKVLYGKSTTTSAIRKVSFNEDSLSDEEDQQEYKVRKTRLVTAATAEKEPPISNKLEKFEKECRQKFEDFETMLKLIVSRTSSIPRTGNRSPAPPSYPLKMEDVVCYSCRNKGHFQFQCPNKTSPKNPESSKDSNPSN